jgi:hypothetical protein
MSIIVGIYKITSPSGRIYIGQSTNIYNRFAAYKYCDRDYNSLRNKNRKSLITDSMRKYGRDAHIFEIIEVCEPSALNDREIFWIDHYKCNMSENPTSNGLNLHKGGIQPPITTHITEETKIKISLKNKENHAQGKYVNVNKSIIKQTLDGVIICKYATVTAMLKSEKFSDWVFRHNFTTFNEFIYDNYKFSFEDPSKFIYKIKKSKIEKTKPERTKNVKIEKIKNVKIKPEKIKNITPEKLPRIKVIKPKKTEEEMQAAKKIKSERMRELVLNKRTSAEWGEYFRNINTGRKHLNKKSPKITEKALLHYKKLHENNKKPIDQYTLSGDFIKTFNSLTEAAYEVNGKYQSLYRVCEGGRKSAYGFK